MSFPPAWTCTVGGFVSGSSTIGNRTVMTHLCLGTAPTIENCQSEHDRTRKSGPPCDRCCLPCSDFGPALRLQPVPSESPVTINAIGQRGAARAAGGAPALGPWLIVSKPWFEGALPGPALAVWTGWPRFCLGSHGPEGSERGLLWATIELPKMGVYLNSKTLWSQTCEPNRNEPEPKPLEKGR